MHTLGNISGSAQLLVANERVEVASLCIEGEGDRRQGCLLISHLLVCLLQPRSCKEATRRRL
jgi:hypothetical protein